METISGDKLRGHLESLILATLDRGEAHGLEILRRLEVGGCGLLKLKEGSLYPALYRLEEAGEISATWERRQTGRRGASANLPPDSQRTPKTQSAAAAIGRHLSPHSDQSSPRLLGQQIK